MADKNLNKSDVKKEIKISYDSAEFQKKVEKIIRDMIKNDKALENRVVDIQKNVMTQFHKAIWTKRGMIINTLRNQGA